MIASVAMVRLPDLELRTSTGEIVALPSAPKESPLVLLFLPSMRASLGVLLDFDERLADFSVAGSRVLAVARASAEEVGSFAEAHSLHFPLLADEAGTLTKELNLQSAGHPVVLVADRNRVVRESVTFPALNVAAVVDRIRRLESV